MAPDIFASVLDDSFIGGKYVDVVPGIKARTAPHSTLSFHVENCLFKGLLLMPGCYLVPKYMLFSPSRTLLLATLELERRLQAVTGQVKITGAMEWRKQVP